MSKNNCIFKNQIINTESSIIIIDATLICLWIIRGILLIPKTIGLIKPLPTGFVL